MKFLNSICKDSACKKKLAYLTYIDVNVLSNILAYQILQFNNRMSK